MKNKEKILKCAGSVSALAIVFSMLVSGAGNAYNLASEAAPFTDVTGKYDLSELIRKNLNTSVMASEKTKTYERRTVVVSLSGDSLMSASGDRSVSEYAASVEGGLLTEKLYAEQDAFLAELEKDGIEYTLSDRYVAIDNAVAIELNTRHVADIRKMSGVESVVITSSYAVPKTQSGSQGSGSAVNNVTKVYGTGVYDSSDAVADGLDGSGMLVAILDTGLDYTHDGFSNMPGGSNPVRYTREDIVRLLADTDLMAEGKHSTSGKNLTASDVYINAKIPFAYDYADNDNDVYPSYSNHGTHVAGIVAGHDKGGYTDKDGNHVDEEFIGVAPEAQLMICKVFTDDLDDPDLGGADAEDLLAALEDCILVGVDVINMSLGTSCGFTTTNDGDDEGEYLNRIYTAIGEEGINLVCAASNDFSSGYGSVFGTNLASNPDSGTVGSPATYAAALSVASISGKKSSYLLGNGQTAVFFEESNDEDNNPFDFIKSMLPEGQNSIEYEYVVIPGVGRASDYTSAIRQLFAENPNRIALVERGDNTFKEKVEIAKGMGAKAIIVYNNVSGVIRMSLGEVDDPIPAVSINMNAGAALVEAAMNHTPAELSAGAINRVGKIVISPDYKAGPFMSEFSSWGTTPDLKLKPEITAHGGEITSTVPGGYDEQSGTSMASPNMAGVVTLIRSYVKSTNPGMTPVEVTRRVNQLMMSTATTVYDADGLPYSPRKQGAGLGSLDFSRTTSAYLWVDDASIDYRPKVELGDDKEKKGVYTVSFKLTNFGSRSLTFKPQSIFMTETLAIDGLTVAEQAHLLTDNPAVWKLNGNDIAEGYGFTVPAGVTMDLSMTLTLSDAEKKYIDDSFKNGMFVEGFAKLISDTDGQCDLELPFLGFYGDWAQAPMLDYDAFELAEKQQDSSILEDEKPQASVWATQPYASYYNEEYVIPMGGYIYLLPDDADKVYASEDHIALSNYNQYLGEDDPENYLTTYKIRGVYAGLLRNARSVDYKLINVDTGELLESDTIYRVGKAYASGGSARPAFVELDLDPVQYDLPSNGHYQMTFEFFLDYEDGKCTKNTYSFDFTTDYEAPLLQDMRVRYYDYKDGNKTRQRIYLDLDVFDNHYAQSVMLCYLENEELILATDYVTPIYNSNKNGLTTVSIEITDIYDKYKDCLYVQLDDYALNHSVYWLNLSAVNPSTAPSSFSLAAGEENVKLTVYGTHTVKLSGIGDASLSNFRWTSNNRSIADVRNGEIVGLSEGSAKITVSNGDGLSKTINVTVGPSDRKLATPSISFDAIRDGDGALVKARGVVEVYPGSTFALSVLTDPWYYPIDQLSLVWESTNPEVVRVDEKGNVTTVAEGTAVVKASIVVDGKVTAYTSSVTLRVLDPFVVSNYALTEYKGPGGVVVIPTDKNIMQIAEDAFRDNDTITEVVIPKSVTAIGQSAFENCTALKKICFVDEKEQPIADADIGVIQYRAFAGCTALETVDFSNVKVVTLGSECFYGCTSLKEIVRMTKIGTVGNSTFAGCRSLKSIDLSGLHVSGYGAFSDCTALTDIKTSWFSDLGNSMFRGCVSLRSVELTTSKIGDSAFTGCTSLRTVRLALPEGETTFTFMIGAHAFSDCTSLQNFSLEKGCLVESIGDGAFAQTELTSFTIPDGLEILGEDILAGSHVSEITISDSFDFENLTLLGMPFYRLNICLAPGTTRYVISGGALYNSDRTTLLLVLNGTTQLTIPSSVTKIGDYAFVGSGVTSVTIPATVREIGKYAFASSKLAILNFAAGTRLTEIPEGCFKNSKLIGITIPESIRSIGDSAFEGSLIASVNFAGNNVETLGNRVFADCSGLRTVVLPDTIETMGAETFTECRALTSATLPSVRKLGARTFLYCPALIEVHFGENAETLGDFTFYNDAALRTVTFGDKVKEIGESPFMGCSALTSIDLHKVTSVGKSAFAGCSKLSSVVGLDRLVEIGETAFYGCDSLGELKLTAAEIIGRGAFATDRSRAGYTVLEIPSVKKIGPMAFMGGRESTVQIPASLEDLGYGAFASSKSLTAFTVSEENKTFFAEDGVLYERLAGGGYNLAAYPGAKKAGSYTVIDKTTHIGPYAFYELLSNALTEVTLPYSIDGIGDCAFYRSGVTHYIMQSINAPVLSTYYHEEAVSLFEERASGSQAAINGLFYANFDSLFANYTDIVGGRSELKLSYPQNGIGYDNYIYRKYFGEHTSLGILMDDVTRAAIEAIDGLLPSDTVKGWSSLEVNDENRATVSAYSDQVKEARRLYNNILSDDQRAFVSADRTAKLVETELLMREIKARFGIQLTISTLTYNDGYKKDYRDGDSFSIDGLVLTIVYDDGSTEIADLSKLKMVTPSDGKLTPYDIFVVFEYRYGPNDSLSKEVQIPVTVQSTGGDSGDSGDDGKSPAVWVYFVIGGGVLVVAGAVLALLLVLKKKKQSGDDHPSNPPAPPAPSAPPTAPEASGAPESPEPTGEKTDSVAQNDPEPSVTATVEAAVAPEAPETIEAPTEPIVEEVPEPVKAVPEKPASVGKPEDSGREGRSVDVGSIVRKTVVGLVIAAVVGLGIFAIVTGDKKDDSPLANVASQIVYHANGGLFENNMSEKTIGYSKGAYPLDIGNVGVINGSIGVSRSSHIFGGWYTAVLDENGNPVYEDDAKTSVKLDQPFDFSQPIPEGLNVSLFARWIKDKTLPILLADGSLTDSTGKTYQAGELIRELSANPQGQFVKYTGENLLNLPNGSYTFVQYYTDSACTTPVSWPITLAEGVDTADPIYAKFIEGDWKIVSDADSAKRMLESLVSGNYYVIADIDLAGANVSISNSATFAARVEGNGHTITGFTVSKRGVESQGTSLFGSLKEGAAIHSLTLENVRFDVMLKGDANEVYFLFGEMPATYDIESFTVKGSMSISCPAGSTIGNLQQGNHAHWILSAGESDDQVLADGKITVEVSCTLGDESYVYPAAN